MSRLEYVNINTNLYIYIDFCFIRLTDYVTFHQIHDGLKLQ